MTLAGPSEPSALAAPYRIIASDPVASEEVAALVRAERAKIEAKRERVESVRTLVSALGDCANQLPSKQRWSLARIIHAESAEHGYDPLFITALVQVESGCKPTANGGGAIGLTQMLPSTAREVARRAGVPWAGPRTLTEPARSLQLGVQYLRELEEMFDDPYKAVAAYNMGPAPVMRMSSQRARRTQYVRRVLARYEQLVEQYA